MLLEQRPTSGSIARKSACAQGDDTKDRSMRSALIDVEISIAQSKIGRFADYASLANWRSVDIDVKIASGKWT